MLLPPHLLAAACCYAREDLLAAAAAPISNHAGMLLLMLMPHCFCMHCPAHGFALVQSGPQLIFRGNATQSEYMTIIALKHSVASASVGR